MSSLFAKAMVYQLTTRVFVEFGTIVLAALGAVPLAVQAIVLRYVVFVINAVKGLWNQ